MAMLERYENVIRIPATRTAGYVNEIIDSIKTVAALGRERETMRVYDALARSASTKNRYLLLGAGGFAVGQAGILLAAALNFYWMAQRLARGTVSVARYRFRCCFAHPVPLI
jgi:ATP-binding cassette subfamily B (MDR/TAP) protein 1